MDTFRSAASSISLLFIVKRYWVLLLVVSVAGFSVGYLYTVVSGKSFEAKGSLIVNTVDKNGSMALNSLVSQGPTPLKMLAGILRSKSVEDKIVADTRVSRKDLRDFLTIDEDVPSNQIRLSMSFKPNGKAVQVIQSAFDALEALDADIGFSLAHRTATTLKETIDRKNEELKKAEQALADFQLGMKISVNGTAPGGSIESIYTSLAIGYKGQLEELKYELNTVNVQLEDAKKRAVATANAGRALSTDLPVLQSWRDVLTRKQYDLKIAKTRLGPAAKEVVRLEKELDVARGQLQSEIEKYIRSVNVGIAPGIAVLEAKKILLGIQIEYIKPLADSAPNEAMQLKRLNAEVLTLQSVVTSLRTKYESAKIEAELDPVRWSVLDPPALEDLPSNYRPVRTGGLLSLAVTLIAFLGFIWRERTQPNQKPT